MIGLGAALNDTIYAAQLGNALLGVNQDAVAVFDSNLNQVFENARPMSADVHPRSKLLDHPLEQGQIVSDHKVILPLEITMPMVVVSAYYRDTYQEIWNLWKASELLNVQTRTGTYINMVIAEMPHEERVERYDAILLRMRFRQVLSNTGASNYAPADETMTDTQSLGFQYANPYTIAATALGLASTARAIAFMVR